MGMAEEPLPQPRSPSPREPAARMTTETVAFGGSASETQTQSPDPLGYLFCDDFDRIYDDFPADCPGNALLSSFGNSGRSSWSSLYPKKESEPSESYSFPVQETGSSMVGAGLLNLGNTCFLNAVMQCFTHTVPLLEGLRSCSHPRPCQRALADFCVLCTLRDHVHNSLSSSGGVISPMFIFDNLKHFSSSFTRYAQEDAHEFLQCFLDKFERSILDPMTVSPRGANLVERVFGGRLVSKLECCNCGHCSETFEPLTDLSLEIEGMDSLPDALRSFTKVEQIEDSEAKFQCENCKQEVMMAKQFMMDKAPSVAVFHLKRFKADGLGVQKIDKHVKFPLELDLQSYTVGASEDVGLKYDLYGIVVHDGYSPNSGHYYSFIRSSPNTWHCLDDSSVTRVSEEHVLSQYAYILFYAKRGTSWFSSFMGEPKMSLNSETGTSSPTSVLDVVDNGCPVVADCGLASSSCLKTVEHTNDSLCTVAPLAETDSHQQVEKDTTENLSCPSTPPRPQTPVFSSFPSPGSGYIVPNKHMKSEEQGSRKRLLNKLPLDSEKREAVRYLTKAMPSSRGNRLMEAIYRPQSEGVIKKKRKLEPCKRPSPANDRHKTSHASVLTL